MRSEKEIEERIAELEPLLKFMKKTWGACIAGIF
jgi:hypothetical protein